jgi:hypothetical protein
MMNNPTSRRDFLQTTAALFTASLGVSAFTLKKKAPLLSFSTLGCPRLVARPNCKLCSAAWL